MSDAVVWWHTGHIPLFTIQWHCSLFNGMLFVQGRLRLLEVLSPLPYAQKQCLFSKLFFECNYFLQSTAANAHGSLLPEEPEACPVNFFPSCVFLSRVVPSEQTYLVVVVHISTMYALYQSYDHVAVA